MRHFPNGHHTAPPALAPSCLVPTSRLWLLQAEGFDGVCLHREGGPQQGARLAVGTFADLREAYAALDENGPLGLWLAANPPAVADAAAEVVDLDGLRTIRDFIGLLANTVEWAPAAPSDESDQRYYAVLTRLDSDVRRPSHAFGVLNANHHFAKDIMAKFYAVLLCTGASPAGLSHHSAPLPPPLPP